jgi:predicted HicB family RNase H-like nuclease
VQIDVYVQALREDLAALAALGDEDTQRAAQLLAAALESALGRRLLEALNEATLELTDQLDGARVEIRLAGDEQQLVLVREQEAAGAGGEEESSARITLRLPESLKARIEAAAAREGASVNTWIVQLLQRSAEPRRVTSSRRLTGFGQS